MLDFLFKKPMTSTAPVVDNRPGRHFGFHFGNRRFRPFAGVKPHRNRYTKPVKRTNGWRYWTPAAYATYSHQQHQLKKYGILPA